MNEHMEFKIKHSDKEGNPVLHYTIAGGSAELAIELLLAKLVEDGYGVSDTSKYHIAKNPHPNAKEWQALTEG